MQNRLAMLAADQKVRFLAVGGTNTLVGYSIYGALTLWVFHDVRFGYLLSLTLSYAIAISLAFVLYRRFVFPVTGNLVRDFIRFVAVYAVAIGVNAALLPLLVEVAGIHPLVAQAIVLVATTCMSFFGHKSFSFRRAPGVGRDAVQVEGTPSNSSARVVDEGSP